jgi:hypothetical protein
VTDGQKDRPRCALLEALLSNIYFKKTKFTYDDVISVLKCFAPIMQLNTFY